MEEAPLGMNSSFSAPTKRKINKRFIYLIIAVLAVIILFFGLKGFSSNNTPSTNNTPVITPTEFPTDTPTPEITQALTPTEIPTPSLAVSPSPEPTLNPIDSTSGLDRSKLTITVQNGSGEVGVASKGSDILKHLGYSVSSPGNADNTDYTGVTIKVKSANSDFLNLLKNDLKKDYTITTSTSDLDNGFSSDALVIIGK